METIHGLIQSYLEENNKELLVKILEEIKVADRLFTVLVRATNNFYLGAEHDKPTAYLFTDKEYADNFTRDVKWGGIQAKTLEIKADQRAVFFSDLYRSGFEAIMIDKGEDCLLISLFGMIEKPEKSDATIMNPTLIRAANQFYQALSGKKAVKQMQDIMCREVYKAKLLVAVEAENPEAETRNLVEKSAKMTFAYLNNQDGKKFFPVFTDWNEFSKFDKKKKYNAVLLGFSDFKKLVRKADGIAVNPFGFNLVLDQSKIEGIEAVNSQEPAASGEKIISLKERKEK